MQSFLLGGAKGMIEITVMLQSWRVGHLDADKLIRNSEQSFAKAQCGAVQAQGWVVGVEGGAGSSPWKCERLAERFS